MQPAPFHQLPGDPLPPAEAVWLRAEDGVRLRAAIWGAEGRTGTVLLFPGRTEYLEKYVPFANRLADQGLAVAGIDWRGQGMSDRLQDDPRPGHVGAFADYQRDVVELVALAAERALPRPWHLLAHSMGGCIGLAAVIDGLPVDSTAFSAPMWGINLRQMPRGMALGLAYVAGRLGRGGRPAPGSGKALTYVLEEGFGLNVLTGDVGEWNRMVSEAVAWPHLTLGGASFHWVSQALNECTRLAALPAPKGVPMLAALGSREQVVDAQAIRTRAASWPGARLLPLDGSRHEPMMETAPIRDSFFAALMDQFDMVG